MNQIKPTSTESGNLHPVDLIVKPSHRKFFKRDQAIFIYDLLEKGLTSREIAKRLFAETGVDLSVQRIDEYKVKFKFK